MKKTHFMKDLCERCEFVEITDHGNGQMEFTCDCEYPTMEQAHEAGFALGRKYIDLMTGRQRK